MRLRVIGSVIGVSIVALGMLVGFGAGVGKPESAQAQDSQGRDDQRERDREERLKRLSRIDRQIVASAADMLERGRQIFRFDTFGDEAFFGGALQLHRAIAGAANGGGGAGGNPETGLRGGVNERSGRLAG